MDWIKEVRYFECTCSECGKVVKKKRGWADLRIAGWKQVGEMLLCPDCYTPYANLTPQIGDQVKCLLKTDKWGKIEAGKVYRVCDLAKDSPGTIYIDVGDGWQRKLMRGEYVMAERS